MLNREFEANYSSKTFMVLKARTLMVGGRLNWVMFKFSVVGCGWSVGWWF